MTRRRLFAAAALGVTLGATALAIAPAGAQTDLVTDYANYPDTPQAQLPDGCDGNGIFGALYSLNGGASVNDPKSLPVFNEGDVVTMTWNATTSFCVGAPVALDVKVSKQPVFDPGDDQQAYVPYAVTTADGGPGSVSFTLPPLASYGFGCAYQFDAIVGLPLAIVGPSGSDYSASVRGDNRRTTLAGYTGYRNGDYEACAAEETTTTTTQPTTTTTSTPVVDTTVPESPTTTVTPVDSVGAAPEAPPVGGTGASGGEAAAENRLSVAPPPASTHGSLANTGPAWLEPLAWLGGLILVCGLLLAVRYRQEKVSGRIRGGRR